MSSRPIHGLILAGGASRRMGRDKAHIAAVGKPQLEQCADLLEPFVDTAWVSVRQGQPADPLRDRYPQVVDYVPDGGPLAGIISALKAKPEADWLVLAVDLPHLDAATLACLLEQATDPRFTAFRSRHDGLPEPLCALYRAGCVELLEQYFESGVRCPRKVLIKSEAELLDLPNPRALDNVNTPDDLRAAGLEDARA